MWLLILGLNFKHSLGRLPAAGCRVVEPPTAGQWTALQRLARACGAIDERNHGKVAAIDWATELKSGMIGHDGTEVGTARMLNCT